MRIIRYDDGTRWGDPNARWGNPSYLLEPGDPGYTPPAASNQPKPKRRMQVTRNSYFPSKLSEMVLWLTNFKNKLPGYAATLGLSAGVATALVADCEWLIYVLGTWLPAVRTFSEACTNASKDAQDGDGSTLMSLPTFTAPAGGTPVNNGALQRIFSAVQQIRDVPACDNTIANDLGLIGSQKGMPDWAVFGPVLRVRHAAGGVTVEWGWQNKREFLHMIEIQVNRGAGWQTLAFDTTPGYIDTEPIPATPTKWEYRAIYRVEDQRIGQWSAVVSVIVGG